MPASLEESAVATDRLGRTLSFMKGLWDLTHALQARSKRMEQQLGITGPQRLVLRLIGRFPGITAGQLAAMLSVHPSTLTGVLRRLEQRRLVARVIDPGDGRRARLELTASGRGLDRERNGTVEAAVQRALSRSSEDTTRAAERLLRSLVEELEKR